MIRKEVLEYVDQKTGLVLNRLILHFTGQRPKDLYKYYKNNYTFVVIFIQELIRRIYKTNLFDEIVCIHGGAQGIDQLSFWACYNLKNAGFPIINKIYVPFSEFPPEDRSCYPDPNYVKSFLDRDISAMEYKQLPFKVTGQEQQWFDGEIFTKDEYHLMISLADYIKILDVKMGYESKGAIGKMLNNRNKAMVFDSMLTLGIVGHDFDYKTATNSGTRNCLRDAIDDQNEVMLFRLPAKPFYVNDPKKIDIDLLLSCIEIEKWIPSTGWVKLKWRDLIQSMA